MNDYDAYRGAYRAHNCEWIGKGERCNKIPLINKSYCDEHYNRVYLVVTPEEAETIIKKQLKETFYKKH